ncbi:hypothetical protein ACS0TY_033314 [Phlomoides rotata]
MVKTLVEDGWAEGGGAVGDESEVSFSLQSIPAGAEGSDVVVYESEVAPGILVFSGLILLPVLLPVAATAHTVMKAIDTTSNGTLNDLDKLSIGHIEVEGIFHHNGVSPIRSDLGDWRGVEENALFNFKPSVRLVPVDNHIQASTWFH